MSFVVDMASIDSPEKSDAGSSCTPGSMAAGSGSGSGGCGLAGLQTNQTRYLNVIEQHRRMHRKFLIFPLQKKCSACRRTHSSRIIKETSLITSSFQIIEEDDFSMAASPIVDLTSQQAESLLLSAENNDGPLNSHISIPSISQLQASVPLPDFLHHQNHHKLNGINKSNSQEKSPSHLFVAKVVRPKLLNPSGNNTNKSTSAKSKKSSQIEAKKQLLPNNHQCVDVKRKPSLKISDYLVVHQVICY
jgi:hypothetical protein